MEENPYKAPEHANSSVAVKEKPGSMPSRFLIGLLITFVTLILVGLVFNDHRIIHGARIMGWLFSPIAQTLLFIVSMIWFFRLRVLGQQHPANKLILFLIFGITIAVWLLIIVSDMT